MRVIDADGHIIEEESVFATLEEEFHTRRPIPVSLPADTQAGEFNRLWWIEGQVVPSLVGKGQTVFFLPGTERSLTYGPAQGDQTLEDVEARLAGMDRFRIDEQIIFPTMFLISAVEDVKLEAALFRAYNDYMSQACARSGGRLHWTALIPFRDPEAAVKEVHRASNLGAAGVFSMGVVFDRQLSDPLFYPVYEAMGDEDLPLCVHLGWGAPSVTQLFEANSFFCSATIPVVWGFTFVMTSGLLGRFPKLRVGFIESGAEWVPYTINQVRRSYKPLTVLREKDAPPPRARGLRAINRELYRDPVDWFKEGRAFVTCEMDEDLPYLIGRLGEDGLMLSSDYPHGDPSADESYVDKISADEVVSDRVKAKLLGENAARFYRL